MQDITVYQHPGLSGCGQWSQCGVPYGTPYGPYGLSQSPAPAPAPKPAPSPGLLASLPSWWPFAGLAVGGVLAVTGIVLMATKK